MADPTPALRVLAAAVSTRRRGPLMENVRLALDAEGDVVLLTCDGLPAEEPPGVRRIDVVARERRHPLHLLLGWTGRYAYRFVRPWVVWRSARTELASLDLASVTDVLVVGTESWPVAWHVARHNPQVRIGFALAPQALCSGRQR